MFIDEITEIKSFTKNFITMTNLSKARIVCSGSNVLAFQFTLQKNKIEKIETTRINYAEWKYLMHGLGKSDDLNQYC